ncbi:MAG TPA: bifunctional UDP-N-acetylglucosamine diphosphorylase/glucosamine-1-phosphate N-acetyltransferase GlmU [Burkholderiaceae bacterium]
MNLVILAAGQGKRMRSELPKVLHALAGRPLLAHVLDTARAVAARLGLSADVVVVVGHGGERVAQAFAGDIGIRFVTQQPQLGTGHAVLQAAPLLNEAEPTLVLYGDVPLIEADTLVGLARAAGDGMALLSACVTDPAGYGRIVRDAAGRVARIVEERDATDAERSIDEINTGFLVAPTRWLKSWLGQLGNDNAQREYYLTDVVALAVRDGTPVAACLAADARQTLGVNSNAQLAQLERIVQQRNAEHLMQQGATLADPARLDVRGQVTVGSDVFIDIGCVFEGRVELGDRVRVGPYCVLRDTTVGVGTEVGAFSHLDGSRIGASARVGPYARLRPGTTLDDEVHIGNFVEVKASRVGQGTKANHLAYVGDAEVGSGTNIGAGTIVANYDGVNKHRSRIGRDVQVGSNTVLVAPIEVGDGATIGAGSTVCREVPSGGLTLARARQVTVADWKRPTKKAKG